MILPICVFGDEALRAETVPVEENTEALQQLIDDMIETMRGASGIGLAAPQVGRRERLFVINLAHLADELAEEGVDLPPQPMALVNPEILWESEATCDYEEGCLSIPDIQEVVARPERIRLRYLDRDFEAQEIEGADMLARVLQHEYDHLEGVLFTDRISPFRRRLLRRGLRALARGEAAADYPLATDEV